MTPQRIAWMALPWLGWAAIGVLSIADVEWWGLNVFAGLGCIGLGVLGMLYDTKRALKERIRRGE